MNTKKLNFKWVKTGEQYGDAASAVTPARNLLILLPTGKQTRLHL